MSGQNEEAINLYFEVIPIRESIGGKGLENTYNNMAIIFRTQNNFEKAYAYFRQSYRIEIQKDNKEGIAGSLINMAITEKHLNRRDSLKLHLWEALTISKDIGNEDLEAHAMINLGTVHREENNSDSALYYFEEALRLSGNSNKGNEVVINVGLADIYTHIGETAKAIIYLDRAETLSQELRSIDFLKRVYLDKSAVYAASGDYKQAYVFHKQFFAMNDSLTNLELVTRTNDLEKKYETERKERKITELIVSRSNVYL